MNKRTLVMMLLLLFTACLFPAVAENITVINKTGYTIYFLEISGASSYDWGDDYLGEDVLLDGDNIQIPIDDFDSCELDIRATDEDDDVYVKWEFNSCERKKVVFTLNDLYVDEELSSIQDFTIQNDTGFDIHYIYVSPDYSDGWEEDVLNADEILSAGDSYDVTFSGYDDYCSFDVRMIDEDGDSYTKWGVDLCSTLTLSISLDDIDY